MAGEHRSKSSARAWLAALFAFGLLFWWLALASPDEAEEVTAAARAPDAPQPSAAPEAAPTSLTAQHHAKVAPVPAPAIAPAAQPSAAPQPPPFPAAPIPPDTRGFIDAIQGRFDSDTRDRDAGSVETALQAFFRKTNLPASALKSIVCRQSVCKLEMYWRAEYDAAYRSVLDDLSVGNAKLVATRAEEPDRNGAVAVDVYWLRVLASLKP